MRAVDSPINEMQGLANLLPQAVIGEPINVDQQTLAAMLMIHEALRDLAVEIKQIRERL